MVRNAAVIADRGSWAKVYLQAEDIEREAPTSPARNISIVAVSNVEGPMAKTGDIGRYVNSKHKGSYRCTQYVK